MPHFNDKPTAFKCDEPGDWTLLCLYCFPLIMLYLTGHLVVWQVCYNCLNSVDLFRKNLEASATIVPEDVLSKMLPFHGTS